MLPAPAYVPDPHIVQLDSAVAACSPECLPALQSVHSPDPDASLYLPAKHLVQGPPSLPLYPALQAQSVTLSLPEGEPENDGHCVQTVSLVAASTAEYLPPSQLVQDKGPDDDLYFPAAHVVQAGIWPVNPAIHAHATAPSSESLP